MSDQANLDLANPTHLRAEMARAGLFSLDPWDSPDTGWTNPLDDPETQRTARLFLNRLWQACLNATASREPDAPMKAEENYPKIAATARAAVEAAVQEAIDEWATIAGGPHADEAGQVPLAHYITSKLLWRFGK